MRNRETRLTSLLGVGAGADFITGKSDWRVVGEVTRRNSKAGQKVSKVTDFLHKVQCSKTSIEVYFQARDPDCRLHLTRGRRVHISVRSICLGYTKVYSQWSTQRFIFLTNKSSPVLPQ